MKASRLSFATIICGIAALIVLTGPYFVHRTNIGLEFRGGYEILYEAASLEAGGQPSHGDLLATARILEMQANSLGISEPEVQIEGQNHIRVKLAGVVGNAQVRALMQSSGQLPVRLTETYSQSVGGVLGATDLGDTIRAGLIALGLIFAFMIAIYRVPGLVAVFSLSVYLWLLLGIFSLLHATLSIAAIVAFILGVGIAADANILSFERVREELGLGHSFATALKEGYRRSIRTVMDSNMSAMIAALILFAAGIGPIRGFALTLILGVFVSLLCNVALSSLLLSLLGGRWLERRIFFGGKKPSMSKPLNIVRYRYLFLGISLAIALLGVGSLMTRELNYDIDFKAGTALDLTVPTSITRDQAARIMSATGNPPATVAIGGSRENRIAARFDDVLTSRQLDDVVAGFKKTYGSTVAYQENTADPAVARDLARRAIYAIIIAIIGMFAFLALRFEWRVAAATTLALLNTTFFVLSAFSLFHLEIDVTFIAAILTVMVYSINDSIVIFDRIRENMESAFPASRADLAALVNGSIRQTFRRSIYTVLTVITGSVCLYFLGAEPLQMFSLAILLGLSCATWSSILLAAPAWYQLKQIVSDENGVIVAVEEA